MRKNKHNTNPCPQQWEDGSYYTGPARPPKSGNGLVVALLVAVIFLGGMASAMGIINFRLISMMDQRSDPMTPMASAAVYTPDSTGFLTENEDPAPCVPQQRDVQLQLRNQLTLAAEEDAFERNRLSLVSVYCISGANQTLSGTGVVLTEDGYILTNAHIVEAATRIFVCLPDGQTLRAATVGSDAFTDLAVLYVQAENLVPAVFADAMGLQKDDGLYALAQQPDAQKNGLEAGSVCALQSLQTGDLSVSVLRSSLQGTTGPVFNEQGQIVAIQAGKIRQYFSDAACGSDGLAIPSATVEAVANQLLRDGHMDGRPALGFQVQAISPIYQHYWDLPGGLLVTMGQTPVEGLEDGDILLTLEGEALSCRSDLYTILYTCHAGDVLTAAVFRDGRTFTVALTVQSDNGQ